MPTPVGVDQVYNVAIGIIPLTPSVGVTLKLTPLQVTAVIALIVAPGLNVITTVNVAPVQFPDKGVTV